MIQRNSYRLIQRGRRLEADHPNIIIHSFKKEKDLESTATIPDSLFESVLNLKMAS